jgi:hypothetical protein
VLGQIRDAQSSGGPEPHAGSSDEPESAETSGEVELARREVGRGGTRTPRGRTDRRVPRPRASTEPYAGSSGGTEPHAGSSGEADQRVPRIGRRCQELGGTGECREVGRGGARTPRGRARRSSYAERSGEAELVRREVGRGGNAQSSGGAESVKTSGEAELARQEVTCP